MQIDNHLISRLQELARLDLSSEDQEKLKGDLEAILAMFEKLGEIDTEHIEPLRHLTDAVHRLRPDEVREELSPEDALKNAPDAENQFFRVPKVLDSPSDSKK